MSQIAVLIDSNKTEFCSILREKMCASPKHNWREKVFEQAIKSLLAKHGYTIVKTKSYANDLGIQCDIMANGSLPHMIEVKRFRSPEACVSVAGGKLSEWLGELKGFPRDYLIDVAKAVLASGCGSNTQGVAIAFIALENGDNNGEIAQIISKASRIAIAFGLDNYIVNFGVYQDNNLNETNLIAVCLSSKV